MVLFAVLSVPIYFLNVQNEFTVLSLVSGKNNQFGFSAEEIQSQVMLYLKHYDNGMRIVHIFQDFGCSHLGIWFSDQDFFPKF